MAVGLKAASGLLAVEGLVLGACYAGIRKKTADDVVVMSWLPSASVAATFTRNAFCAAPVQVSRVHLSRRPRALIINAGNANAGTGSQGLEHAYQSCDTVADALDISPDQVLTFSTGVIFEPLAIEKLQSAAKALCPTLRADQWDQAARAIMTTDTLAKGLSKQIELSFGTVTITGIVKGSGMIRPNMATMLSFVATDAAVDAAALDALIRDSVDKSFNSITVDSDTSTNDSCVLIATGARENTPLQPSSTDWSAFAAAIDEVMLELAHALVRDGEGATKFITVAVDSARSIAEAKVVGFEVAHSPLVKTAFFAEDPNLGRLLMAIGKSDVDRLDVEKISLWLGDMQVVKDGQPHPKYDEAEASELMKNQDVAMRIDLGRGDQSAKVWTCDLSYEYIRINADYRS